MIKLPDVILQETVEIMLKTIRDDFRANTDETKSILYKMFEGSDNISSYNLFEQSKSLLITEPDHPKHLRSNLSYNPNDAKYPQIVITLPQKSTGDTDSLGIGEGDMPANPDYHDDDWSRNFTRSFKSTYNMIIIGDNKNEIVLIEQFLTAGLMATTNHLELLGLRNVKYGASDINWNGEVAAGIFRRSVWVKFDYEITTPEWFVSPLIRAINFNLKVVENFTE